MGEEKKGKGKKAKSLNGKMIGKDEGKGEKGGKSPFSLSPF